MTKADRIKIELQVWKEVLELAWRHGTVSFARAEDRIRDLEFEAKQIAGAEAIANKVQALPVVRKAIDDAHADRKARQAGK